VEGLIPPIAPAVVLSILVGTFQTCLYVVIRGTIGKHLPLTLITACAGAYVGHLVGRLAGDPVQLGDLNVLWASIGAWVGIIVVAGIAAIRPARRPDAGRHDRLPGGGEDGVAAGAATGTTSATGTTTGTGPGTQR
jgi:hypothetical protein